MRLHDTSIQIGVLFLVLAVVWLAFLIRVRVKEREWDRMGLIVTPALVIVGFGATTYMEHGYDARDEEVRVKLNRAGVSVVRMDGSDHVVVERVGCIADFVIQGGVLEYPKVWPLVPGTGKAVSGCPDDRLDDIFFQ